MLTFTIPHNNEISVILNVIKLDIVVIISFTCIFWIRETECLIAAESVVRHESELKSCFLMYMLDLSILNIYKLLSSSGEKKMSYRFLAHAGLEWWDGLRDL
jgi:hypothetical protein